MHNNLTDLGEPTEPETLERVLLAATHLSIVIKKSPEENWL
jgi:hypothetical protein